MFWHNSNDKNTLQEEQLDQLGKTSICIQNIHSRYTHYDENGHRIGERVTNERYTSQFDSDPVDCAFGDVAIS